MIATRDCTENGPKLKSSFLDILFRRQRRSRIDQWDRRPNNWRKRGANFGNGHIGWDQESCANSNRLNTFQVTVVPQKSDDWRDHCARLRQEMTQTLYVGGMAKTDIDDHHGHGRESGLLFV